MFLGLSVFVHDLEVFYAVSLHAHRHVVLDVAAAGTLPAVAEEDGVAAEHGTEVAADVIFVGRVLAGIDVERGDGRVAVAREARLDQVGFLAGLADVGARYG